MAAINKKKGVIRAPKVRVPQVRVYPYKQGSASAKKLADVLGGKVLKLEGSKYVPRHGDLVVNWGSSTAPHFPGATTLNSSEAVKVASDKRLTFNALNNEGVSIPAYLTHCDKQDAVELGFPVVCRTKLNGHSGEGIVIANNAEELVDAPLYTKYVKKKDEYRVHVVNEEVIFIQRKARKLEEENPNWQVRNLAGGFVFVAVGVDPDHEDGPDAHVWDCPEDVTNQAVAAIRALGLDFGGVDVMWNEREGKAYVLEVNTACGLEDRTAEKYADALRQLLPV